MPKRKFGKSAEQTLKNRTKGFLQSLGFNSFVAEPIIAQLRPADLKVKYNRKSDVEMTFESLDIGDGDHVFDFIKVTVSKCKFSFVLYISEKDEWRCFVPVKGNYFCKKKKKVYGFCGCHDEDGIHSINGGSFEDEIKKRMQFGGYSTRSVKIKNSKCKKGEPTHEWRENENNPVSLGSIQHEVKRTCTPRVFEKMNLVQDLVWTMLQFVPQEDLFLKIVYVCKLWNSIVHSDVFHKQMWNHIRKGKTFDIMTKSSEIGEFTFIPGKFRLDPDGIYESMCYKLESIPEQPNYYNLNKAHMILPKMIEYLYKEDKQREEEDKIKQKKGLLGIYSRSYLFPYPLHENFPCPVILRRDLNHKYVHDENEIRKTLKEICGDDEYKIEDMGFDDIEEAISFLKEVHEKTEKRMEEYTEARRVIMKIFRAKVEYEYFDYDLAMGKKVKDGDSVSDDLVGFDNNLIEHKQMKVSEYLDEELPDFQSCEDEGMTNLMISRVKKVIEDLKKVCKRVTIYRTSQLDMEELGFLWIVGEFSDQFLIGYTWGICAN